MSSNEMKLGKQVRKDLRSEILPYFFSYLFVIRVQAVSKKKTQRFTQKNFLTSRRLPFSIRYR